MAELLLRSNPQIANALRATYPFIFVDEFQDTTFAQYDFLYSVFRGSSAVITGVGDDKQRIMGWAGARPDAFARLEADFHALRVPLLFNFRSSPDLVAIQHVVARVLDPSSPQVVAKTGKLIDGDVAQIWNSPTCAQETRHLATWLASDMTRRGRRPRDYAILVKQKAEAVDTELRAPMAASGLRIRNESALVGKVPLQDLLSDSLCRLVVAALRLGSVQRSPKAWQYLSAAVSALRAIPPGDDAADARAEAALSRFLAGLRKDMTETAPSAEAAVNIAEAVLTFLDPAAVQRTYVEYGAGNLLEIVVEGLLQHLMASATGVSTWSECLDAFEGLDQIPLMTVHKSKGLEYDTIVFMGLDDQAWWAHKPGDKEGLAAFFVALSRAKQRAIFAFCQQRGQRSKVAELYALLGQAGVPEIAI
ncbi:UvrD-helicase domain-containing protein [Brevundimonas sp. PWP3-1b1]